MFSIGQLAGSPLTLVFCFRNLRDQSSSDTIIRNLFSAAGSFGCCLRSFTEMAKALDR